jgi:hypothetical protein
VFKLNNRLLAVGLILCIASIALIGTVQAQTVVAGVTAGSVYDYHVFSNWSTADSYSSIPEDLISYNHTAHVEVRISDVNTTNIATFAAYYFNNGSDPVASRGNVNFLTGSSYGDFVAIIGANLNAGDTIHPSGTDGLTVKDTVTRTYESGSRVTNHVQQTATNATTGITATRDLYFDKATGMLVEEIDRSDTTDPVSTSVVTWKIDSVTGVEGWVIPEFPTLIAVPIFLIAAAFAAVAYKKKFLKVSAPL